MMYPPHKTGFTLIETLIAISILVLAVLGPMTMLSKAITNSAYAKNQITANYLAQEGLEFVIHRRDAIYNTWPESITGNKDGYFESLNWLWGGSATAGLSDCVTSYCAIDAVNWEVYEKCGALCQIPLRLSEDKLYQYDSGEETMFTRSVRIDPIESTNSDGEQEYNEARVKVHVEWRNGSQPRSYDFETLIMKQGSSNEVPVPDEETI